MTVARIRHSLHIALPAISLAAAAAHAGEPGLAQQRDQLACGGTLVIAQASCYEGTALCVREALTFRRIEGSTTVAPHKHLASHTLPDGRRVDALDYRIARWACVRGVNGGRYVAVIAARTAGGDCSVCEYLRIYHANGRLIAATLRFDARDRPREDEKAAEIIGKVIARPGPGAFVPVYVN